MAVFRLEGRHLLSPGSPRYFATKTGAIIDVSKIGNAFTYTAGGRNITVRPATITPIFSRKEESANLDAVRTQHSTAFAQFDSSKHNSLHITNNTEYIHRLNEGWSAQTYPGFFERALYEAQKSIRGTWRVRSLP